MLSYSEPKFAKTRHCTPRLIRKCKLTCHRQTRSAQSDAQSAFREPLAPRPSCASVASAVLLTVRSQFDGTDSCSIDMRERSIAYMKPQRVRSARGHQVELDHEGYNPLSRTSGGAAGAASALSERLSSVVGLLDPCRGQQGVRTRCALGHAGLGPAKAKIWH